MVLDFTQVKMPFDLGIKVPENDPVRILSLICDRRCIWSDKRKLFVSSILNARQTKNANAILFDCFCFQCFEILQQKFE